MYFKVPKFYYSPTKSFFMKTLKTVLLLASILTTTSLCAMEEGAATSFTDYTTIKQKLTDVQTAQKESPEFRKQLDTDLNIEDRSTYMESLLGDTELQEQEMDLYLQMASITQNPQHPNMLEAALDILNHRNDADKQIRITTDEAIISAANNPEHENWFSASLQLLYSPDKEHKALAHKIITKFVQDALRQVPETHAAYANAQMIANTENL